MAFHGHRGPCKLCNHNLYTNTLLSSMGNNSNCFAISHCWEIKQNVNIHLFKFPKIISTQQGLIIFLWAYKAPNHRWQGYWVIGASKQAARLIQRCVKCRKLRRQNQVQKMADLPDDRLNPAPPFTNSGTDFSGPFYIKEGRRELKRWGCVFTCLASRAIHLEVAISLSTDAFINVLRRFISLRGTVQNIRCDRGTNFVGASHELKQTLQEISDDQIRHYLADHGCEFEFNPPHASHMGGIWERQIRTVRSVLASLMADHASQLDDDSLRTLMAEVAAIVNSRPLTTDTLNDPTGLTPITPNHLLLMKSSIVLPPPGQFQKPDLYSRKRWRRVQFIAEQFWSRWKREYIQDLQRRQRWSKPARNIKTGDIVLIDDDSLPRNHWKLGRIEEVIPSKDLQIRKAKILVGDPCLDKNGKRIKTPSYLERPIHKLVLLLETQWSGKCAQAALRSVIRSSHSRRHGHQYR